MIKDRRGKCINIGDRLRYLTCMTDERIGYTGILIENNGVLSIKWDANSMITPVGDWDSSVSKRFIKIYD